MDDWLTAAARARPGHVAIAADDGTATFAELDERAHRRARELAAAGVGPGDRVGLVMPNVPPFPVLFYGALAIGAVVVPMARAP